MNVIDSFSLKGKTALVTGGAGAYGQQLVQALAEADAVTYIASRNLPALEKVAAEHRQRGHDVRPVKLDQGEEGAILAVRDLIRSERGSLDILVNNAVARPVTQGYFDDASAMEESLRINGAGLILVTRTLGEVMADQGSIINIGSMMGLVGVEPLNYRGTDMSGWYPDYAFHKGGMVNLTRFLASYYGSRGIRCNCIHPGGLESPNQPAEFVQNYNERTCLGRLATHTDLKGIVVFLASDASSYITGTNIPVDGGYTAK